MGGGFVKVCRSLGGKQWPKRRRRTDKSGESNGAGRENFSDVPQLRPGGRTKPICLYHLERPTRLKTGVGGPPRGV